MKYKEIVDDIQIQFKSHNESVKTQNPYWILFRFITELTGVRDELLQKISDIESIPEWMISTSYPLSPVISNSAGSATSYDDIKFAVYKLPDYYPLFSKGGIVSVDALMKQIEIYQEDYKTVMLRIKADDQSLKESAYAYVDQSKLFVYPVLGKVTVRYIPKLFAESMDTITDETVINSPDFIVEEARKRVVESVLLQKQMPEDDRPDQIDQPTGIPAKNRQ